MRDTLAAFAAIWTVVNSLFLLAGMLTYSIHTDRCIKPIAKIEYVMPGHVFGCWLAAPWGK